jgi:ferredoxin-type protein NapF
MNSATNQLSNSRRNFLRGNITDRVHSIRPPWSVSEALFLDKCDQCNDCLDACPENIISHDADGYPYIDFSHAGCTFCAECLESCKTGALQGLRSDIDQAWRHSMRISDSCLSVTGVVCRACGDHCDEGAIKFTLLTLGRSLPEISSRSCTGCGQCIPVCPSNAISIHETIEGSL